VIDKVLTEVERQDKTLQLTSTKELWVCEQVNGGGSQQNQLTSTDLKQTPFREAIIHMSWGARITILLASASQNRSNMPFYPALIFHIK
jgi:hypothetical protein